MYKRHGLGFLEAVPDADIMKMADPEYKDGDGVSGVPNWIELPDFVKPATNATVSYTHLDVYKRQPSRDSNKAVSSPQI